MTSSLLIPNTPPLIRYTGNGAQTAFPYPFPIFQETDIVVTVNDAVQIANYAVTNAGETDGGTVLFDTAPPNQSVVTLERRLPLQRVTDFLEGGELSANALNSEFDYLTACTQQLQNDTEHTLRFNKSEGDNETLLPARAARLNKVLGFDGNGDITVMETAQTYGTPTVIQTGTGAAARNLTDKVKEVVSVKDFGAIGDGVADDTAAFLNALAAHTCVHVPPGTYRITNTIEIGNNALLSGAGHASVIKAASNGFDTLCLIGKDAIVGNLTIDGGDSGVRIYGKTSPAIRNTLRNLTIKNVNIGVELDGYTSTSNPCAHNAISHVTIEKPSLHGVHVTRSGAGSSPHANKFHVVRVFSSGTAMTGSGFFIESARFANSFVDCSAELANGATACFRVGAESTKTLLFNAYCSATAAINNVQLDSGSTDTAIVNLRPDSSGTIIADGSGGNYTAINVGTMDKTSFPKARINDLTTDQQRYTCEFVAFATPQNVTVDLTKTVYFVSAASAATGVVLPKAVAGNTGAVVTIKKTDATTNLVTVSENTGTGPDGKILKMGAVNDLVTVISDGSAWRILASNMMQKNCIAVSGVALYKPDLSKSLILVTALTGGTTIELPPASATTSIGRMITVKKIDATTNAMRVTEEAAVGPDNAIQSTTVRYGTFTVMSDGVTWHVIAKF